MRARAKKRAAGAVRAQPRALARRYAKALLEVARAQGEAAPAALESELAAHAALVEGHAELRRALADPARAAGRRRLLSSLAEKAGASPLLRRFFDLLAANDRAALLPAVAEEFAAARGAAEGRVSAEAVTALPLSPPQRAALAEALGTASGRTVELRTRVDPAVLGGVLVNLGGRSYDGTVRARLRALRERLAGR